MGINDFSLRDMGAMIGIIIICSFLTSLVTLELIESTKDNSLNNFHTHTNVVLSNKIDNLENDLKDFNKSNNLKLEERNWIYIVDENTGKKVLDPETGFPIRINKSRKIYDLIQANNSQQETLNEIITWINSVRN